MKWYKKQMDALNVAKAEPSESRKELAAKNEQAFNSKKNRSMTKNFSSPVAASKLQRQKTDSI